MSMGSHTKRLLDATIDELKRDGFESIVIMLNSKADEDQQTMEIACSMNKTQEEVEMMAQQMLAVLSQSEEEPN